MAASAKAYSRLGHPHADSGVWTSPCHDLRRLAATNLVVEGVDVKTIQTRLGHASPQITLALYAQTTGTGDRNAARQVGCRLMGNVIGVTSEPLAMHARWNHIRAPPRTNYNQLTRVNGVGLGRIELPTSALSVRSGPTRLPAMTLVLRV
jgi:hypothetical protein